MSDKLKREILDRIEELLEAVPKGKDPTGETAVKIAEVLMENGIDLVEVLERIKALDTNSI